MDYSAAGKRRGLMKGKLMSSLYRAAAKQQQQPKKVTPKQLATNSVEYLVNQDMKPQPMLQNNIVSRPSTSSYYSHDSVGRLSNYFCAVDDERVNMRASNYISSVRERFRLEGSINS
ncbi:hypothetical protein Dimus_013104 [Dionaea muscipula]